MEASEKLKNKNGIVVPEQGKEKREIIHPSLNLAKI